MKALVTGGAGFIGSHICRDLAGRGVETVVLDDLSKGRIENVPPDAMLIRGSITDADAVAESMDGADVVFHLAARVSTRESLITFREDASTNIMGTLNVLEQCRSERVERVIFSSSAAVYRNEPVARAASEDSPLEPESPYGISKLAGELYVTKMCELCGIDYVVLRYFNVYGPGQTPSPYAGVISVFVNSVLEGRAPVIYGDGEQTRDFIHIDDVVRANILAMDTITPNTVFNIGTGVTRSINALAHTILTAMDSDLVPVHGEAVDGEIRYSAADVSKARELLAFKPESALEDRIVTVIDWMKDGNGP